VNIFLQEFILAPPNKLLPDRQFHDRIEDEFRKHRENDADADSKIMFDLHGHVAQYCYYVPCSGRGLLTG